MSRLRKQDPEFRKPEKVCLKVKRFIDSSGLRESPAGTGLVDSLVLSSVRSQRKEHEAV